MVVAGLQERRLRARILGSSQATDREDAYATLLTPQSYVAAAQSSIGFQPVFSGRVLKPRTFGSWPFFVPPAAMLSNWRERPSPAKRNQEETTRGLASQLFNDS